MVGDTIDNDITVSGGSGTLLAGRYRVVRQLGAGGMGSVWLAEDTQLDNKPFAIKMLPSILVSNKRAYRQLKDEALVAMRLVHPNIVQIRAFEENNGNPFLVMDYIDGETLDDYLAEVGNGEQGTGNGRARSPSAPQGYLPESDVLRILKPIAAALDYAHGEGVVHRDVKPANVMIRKDGHPFILDFGIAREIQETMTRVTGKLSSGTLLYMSPEQLNGDAPKPAQDVYSFAAMAYECLKGEPSFSRGNIEFQIMNKQPEPLPGGPRSVAAGIMAGLAKKPEGRPASCVAVLERGGFNRVEHAECVDGAKNTGARRTAVRIHPQPTRETLAANEAVGYSPSRKQKESNRIGVGIAVGILALFVSLVVGGLWLMLGRTEASDAVMTPDPAKVSADAIFSEARANMAACKRLDSADGFRERIEECQSSFDSAKGQYDLGHWSVAAQAFTNVSEKCRALVAADVERDNAKTAASLLSESIKAAKDAEAQKFAKSRFESATKTADRGRAEFGDFKFAAAAATYELAKEQFDLAARESVQAKEAEERKRREAEESAQRAEVAKIRAEAIVQRGKVARISDSEGFKERKDRLGEVFMRAEAYYGDDARQWLEAAACFREYIEQGEALVQLDKERGEALSSRQNAIAASKAADQEGAKKYATDNWNRVTKGDWARAEKYLKNAAFKSAKVSFDSARDGYNECVRSARQCKLAADVVLKIHIDKMPDLVHRIGARASYVTSRVNDHGDAIFDVEFSVAEGSGDLQIEWYVLMGGRNTASVPYAFLTESQLYYHVGHGMHVAVAVVPAEIRSVLGEAQAVGVAFKNKTGRLLACDAVSVVPGIRSHAIFWKDEKIMKAVRLGGGPKIEEKKGLHIGLDNSARNE